MYNYTYTHAVHVPWWWDCNINSITVTYKQILSLYIFLKSTLEGNGYTSCDSYNAAHVHVGTDIEMNFSYMYSTLILSFCTPDGAMYISSLYVYIISLYKLPEIIAYTR